MKPMKSDTLSVPCAQLYYEVRGSGPILLMIPAGGGDASSYRRVAEYLASYYTVITYDRRGFSRSPLDNLDQVIEISTHSSDVDHLLEVLASEPAYLFGCSIGALIGLDYALHYPARLRKLVAHEPPVPSLLSEAEQAEVRQAQQTMTATYKRDGAQAAVKQFATSVGVTIKNNQNVGQEQASLESALHNREAFLRYDTRAAALYKLDIRALQADHHQIVLGGGLASHESWPYHGTVALAQALGATIAEFPGNHSGFADHPQEFAEKLHEVLSD